MSGLDAIQLSGSNGPTKPIRIDNARTRTMELVQACFANGA